MNTAVPDLPPRSSLRVAVAYGAIGGFVGGVFMVPMLVLTATIIGLPPSTFPTAFGLSLVLQRWIMRLLQLDSECICWSVLL